MQLRRKDDGNLRQFRQNIGLNGNKKTSRGMNIYIGNLSRDVTENDLRSVFSPFGKIVAVKLIKDKYNGKPKGFGFVEMPISAEANAAIDKLNGKLFKGQTIKVSEAHSNPPNYRNNRNQKHRAKVFN